MCAASIHRAGGRVHRSRGWWARGGRRLLPRPPCPLVLLSFLPLLLVLFSLVTWQVAADGPLRRGDERLGRMAQGSLPGPIAQFLADLGGVQVAVPVLALAVGYAAWRGRRRGSFAWWRRPVTAALAMAAVPALVVPLKALVARPGPPGAGPCDCYPSGHAATAAIAYGTAALLLGPWLPGRRARRLALAGALLLNVGVGAGLVVRGYHWPLDVLGSWLLGAVVGLGVVLVGLGVRTGLTGDRADESGGEGCRFRNLDPPA